MDIELVIERAERVDSARRDAADADSIKQALRAVTQLRSWLSASEADLTARLRPQVTFPEKDVAECTRSSLGEAVKTNERAETLAAVPEFATALDTAAVTQAHVDEITKKGKGLTDAQRAEFHERVAALVAVAAVATVREFGKRLDHERRAVERTDGLDRLARQRTKVEFRDWTDAEGMYCYAGRLDPVSAVSFRAHLDHELRRLFAEGVPDNAPTDPILRQRHLAGLAIVSVMLGANGPRAGANPAVSGLEGVVVIDADEPDGAGGPTIDWGIPVEVPVRVLAELVADGHVTAHTVVVRNGVVLHAPGALNLGRTARLANRAQRRALSALYATCAIPGCAVHVRYTKAHHVRFWEDGGCTDLDNLLPVCPHHHTLIHQHRWQVSLGANRELTIRFPDGSVQSTGPPSRRSKAA